MNLKKFLDIICYLFLPISLVLLSFILPYKETFNYFGWGATILLLFILFIKPMGMIFNITWMRRWVGYRRQLGVAIFWLTLFHSVMLIYELEFFDVVYYLGWDNYLFYGMIATVGIVILGITSNTWSVRMLKRNWKKLQYITYPVFALTLIHIGIFRGMLEIAISVIVVYFVLKIMEFRGMQFYKTN